MVAEDPNFRKLNFSGCPTGT